MAAVTIQHMRFFDFLLALDGSMGIDIVRLYFVFDVYLVHGGSYISSPGAGSCLPVGNQPNVKF